MYDPSRQYSRAKAAPSYEEFERFTVCPLREQTTGLTQLTAFECGIPDDEALPT